MRGVGRLIKPVVGGILVLLLPVSAAHANLREKVEELAAQIIQGVPEGRTLRVAVADLPDLRGVTSDLGRFVAERLTTRLAQAGRFAVIERRRLTQVLGELKFSMSDLVDPAKAKRLGQMLGVEALVVGSVSDLGNQVDVDVRLIEIETNRMMLGASATITKDQVVATLLQEGREGERAIVQAPSGPITAARPAAQPTARFSHKLLAFEVISAEIVGDEIRVNAVFTNQTEGPARVVFLGDANNSYLVDNHGTRYVVTADSLQGRSREFAPGVPERVWITFGKVRTPAASVNLALGVNFKHERLKVLLRNIPLSK